MNESDVAKRASRPNPFKNIWFGKFQKKNLKVFIDGILSQSKFIKTNQNGKN